MSYIPAKYDYSTPNWDHEDYGVIDQKGRKVGGAIVKRTVTVTAKEIGLQGYYGTVSEPVDLGVWYMVCHQATRNGKVFGASAKESRFRSEAARDKHAEISRKRARALAQKKFRADG